MQAIHTCAKNVHRYGKVTGAGPQTVSPLYTSLYLQGTAPRACRTPSSFVQQVPCREGTYLWLSLHNDSWAHGDSTHGYDNGAPANHRLRIARRTCNFRTAGHMGGMDGTWWPLYLCLLLIGCKPACSTACGSSARVDGPCAGTKRMRLVGVACRIVAHIQPLSCTSRDGMPTSRLLVGGV